MKKFETGRTYETRSACDHEAIFSYEIVKRTAKMATLRDKFGEIKRRGIRASYCGGYETIYPEGHYSMCPVITAERTAA